MIVYFRVNRDLTIYYWSLNIEGSFFLLSHPTLSEAAKLPKPIPFRVLVLNSFYGFLLSFNIVLKVRR